MINIPKDPRNKAWEIIEKEIQLRAKQKDKNFILTGNWKKFIKHQQGYQIFLVDGNWVRTNLSVAFTHGGHGLVHEFIPINEIWIASHHYAEGKSELANCFCKTNKKKQSVSKNFFDSTIIHEITECEEMKTGRTYWKSHQMALMKEQESGLLRDPFDDQ